MSDSEGRKRISGTLLRFATAVPLILLVVWVLFAAPPHAFPLLLAGALALCSFELLSMMLPDRILGRLAGTAATLAVVATLHYAPDPRTVGVTLGLLVLAVMVLSLASPKPIETAALRVGWLLAAPLYLGALAAPLLGLFSLPDGGAWVLMAMFFAFLSDTSAYFAGRAFGRRPLMPTVSPKKTVEGAIGGLVGATLGGLAIQATLLDRIPFEHILALGIVASALGQAGDLFASLLKRSAGVKDSGRILPGHGGVLDRIDALLFTGACTWGYAHWIAP